MRFSGISGRFLSLAIGLSAAGSAAALVTFAPAAHAHILTDCTITSATPSCPTPTPVPSNAFLSLDVTAGDPNTQITVNGGAFLPNESMNLVWDPPSNKVAGTGVADGSGNFTTHVKPFSGDPPGLHHLCASVQPNPCASFTLQPLATTPTPQESPSPSPDTSPSASPDASPSASASPSPVAATLNGVDLFLKPPFVILPIIGGLGIAIALIYWVLSIVRRPREKLLKSVAVAHLASRPDYGAGFGTPPPVPASPAPPPSAWADVLPPTPAPAAPPPAAAPPVEAAPGDALEWSAPASPEPPAAPPGESPPDVTPAPDDPPDVPKPGDY
jgi:hypothetical protein